MKLKDSKKIVLFYEDIRPFHYPCLMLQLWRGREVYVFDFNCNLKKQMLVRYLINNDVVKRIYIKPGTKEHGDAIDQTETIFNNLRENKLTKIISSLYETDEISLIFKRTLVNEIFKCIYVNKYLSEIEKSFTRSCELYFVPVNYKINEKIITRYGDYNLFHFEGIKIYRWTMLLLPVVHFFDKLKYYIASFFYILLQIVFINFGSRLKGKRKTPVHFEYAIPIDQVFQTKFKGKRGFDFLLDHTDITIKNTVFLLNIPVNEDWLGYYKGEGYNFFTTRRILNIQNLINVRQNYSYKKNSTKTLLEMFMCWHTFAIFMHAFFVSIRAFIIWELIYNHISFKNYVYTNKESAGQLGVNILIRKQGGVTWNYACFLGGGYLNSKNVYQFKECRHIIWSFLNSDYFVGMNEDVISYYQLHCQDVRKYYSIGSIYSEMVHENIKFLKKEELFAKYFLQSVSNDEVKVVSFFDTSFIDSVECETNFQDCIDFYQDILRLLNSLEDIFVIIKPSKSEAFYISPKSQWYSPQKGREIINLWDTLKANARVSWAGDSGDIPAIMALSDLVVTHCMSSPTAEALGARKKAIWYEHGNKHCGLMYDKIPGLIAHGYKKLEQRIEDLLYKISDEEYNEYLDKYIKGKVESHLDGLALTRFRQLLVKSN